MTTRTQAIENVLDVLRGALGLGESPAGSNHNAITDWYNANVDHIGNGPWCEMTATWAMWTGGAKSLKKGRAYTVWGAQDAQRGENGSSWHWGTEGLAPGDQVYYDWTGRKGNVGLVDHTGICERVLGNGQFYVLEGNFGDKLQRMLRDSKFVVGYTRFAWDTLVTDAPAAPAAPPVVIRPGVPAPIFPLPAGSYFGPKTGPDQSVSGYFSHRADLARWQTQMIARGWDLGPDGADGLYGPTTEKVARGFQAEKGLTVDGEIGPDTWAAAWTSPVTA